VCVRVCDCLCLSLCLGLCQCLCLCQCLRMCLYLCLCLCLCLCLRARLCVCACVCVFVCVYACVCVCVWLEGKAAHRGSPLYCAITHPCMLHDSERGCATHSMRVQRLCLYSHCARRLGCGLGSGSGLVPLFHKKCGDALIAQEVCRCPYSTRSV